MRTSPSPAVITSANGASGSGLTKVTAPPITTSGSCFVRASARTGNARQPQHRHDVGVVPLERHGERDHVEVADGSAGLDRAERLARGELRGELLPAGQEDALAHDVLQLVEEPVDGLEAQVGHSDEVRVRERERDAKAAAVRFADVADFPRKNVEDVARAPVGLAGLGACHMNQVPTIRETELRRRRSRVPWIYLVYHLRRPRLAAGLASPKRQSREGGSPPAAAAGRPARRAATPARIPPPG